MGRVIGQTTYEALEAGAYRARLGSVAMEPSEYSDTGEQVAMRWDLTEPGYEGKSIRAWANPKLSGGKKPSKLYTWCSMLLFGGRPLPEDWQLDLDSLLDREAQLIVEIKPDTGYNRVVQVLPIRQVRATPAPNAQPPALQPRAASAQPSQPSEPPDWPEWSDDNLSDPGPTDEDEN